MKITYKRHWLTLCCAAWPAAALAACMAKASPTQECMPTFSYTAYSDFYTTRVGINI